MRIPGEVVVVVSMAALVEVEEGATVVVEVGAATGADVVATGAVTVVVVVLAEPDEQPRNTKAKARAKDRNSISGDAIRPTPVGEATCAIRPDCIRASGAPG